ncbi:MAG: GSCFA domain-containing protein, partial [Alistipes sp.]|nr:GSCFA domain-containing protein [Alistipes sp.]
MQFRTTIDLRPFDKRIDHSQPILSLGSCFASNVAERLSRAKFCITSSPTGILFNPESIAAMLDRFDAVARGDNG